MRLFLDSSVVIAASLSSTGASRVIFEIAAANGWSLLISPWVLREVRANLARQSAIATQAWFGLRTRAAVETDEITFDWPLVFEVAKDKPVLCTALACADVLLTLDRRDFQGLLGTSVYRLRILTPGEFLRREREAGRIL